MRFERLNIASSQAGNSLVEVAFFLPLLFLLLSGVVDFGRGYYLANEVAGAAHAGAVYGSQDITDTTDMITAAKLAAPDVSGLSPTASWGCECSDGTQSSASCTTTPASCSANVVYYASVTVTATYTPIMPWKGIGSSFTITRSATMRSASE
jgi:Flp pilus assembly protein TadG